MDSRVGYDQIRQEGLQQQGGSWRAHRHADVMAIANDPETFSSAVSRFLQVPNGLDGKAHTRMRALLDPFFEPARIARLEPMLRGVADELVSKLPHGQVLDAVAEMGEIYAVRGMLGWLGWPSELETELLDWMAANHAAARSGELSRTAEVAERFNTIIRRVLAPRRAAGPNAPDDPTTELLRLLADEPDADEVIVSVLRNWTGGDLGSIALCIGVLVHWMATYPEQMDHWRQASDHELDRAIDEVLRIDSPFVANRRVATRDVKIAGQQIQAGDQVVLNWTAANRDPAAFGDADAYHPTRNAAKNVVYGAGPHVCPGRGLSTLELRVFVRSLLAGVRRVTHAQGQPAIRELPPVGGFQTVPVVLS